jgi:hypothetical protein
MDDPAPPALSPEFSLTTPMEIEGLSHYGDRGARTNDPNKYKLPVHSADLKLFGEAAESFVHLHQPDVFSRIQDLSSNSLESVLLYDVISRYICVSEGNHLFPVFHVLTPHSSSPEVRYYFNLLLFLFPFLLRSYNSFFALFSFTV